MQRERAVRAAGAGDAGAGGGPAPGRRALPLAHAAAHAASAQWYVLSTDRLSVNIK